jgi:hypothetical protein
VGGLARIGTVGVPTGSMRPKSATDIAKRAFFFGKKNQKTFDYLHRNAEPACDSGEKFFAFAVAPCDPHFF